MTVKITEGAPAVRTFVAYRLVSRGYFHLSILYVFLLDQGDSVLSVAAVLAAYGLALAALTPLIPTIVARLGPGRSLVAGELTKAVGLIVLAAGAEIIPIAMLAQAINALGFALALSADAALLSRLGDSSLQRALQASTQSFMFIALLASGVAGGALYLVDPHWPLVAGAVSALAAAGVAVLLGRQVGSGERAGGGQRAAAQRTRSVTSREIRWVTYYVMTRGFMLGAFIGLLPYLFFHKLGIGVLTLTLILAAYSFAAFVTARYANRLMAFGGTSVAIATGLTVLLSFLAFAVSSATAVVVVAMILLGTASGCVRPVTMAQLGEVTRELGAGPVPGWLLSRMEGLFGVCNALVILVGGLLTYYESFTTAMLVLCAAYVSLQLIADLLARTRVPLSDQVRAQSTT